MYDLETSGTGHLENIGVTDKDIVERAFTYIDSQPHGNGLEFPNLLFHLAQILSLITYIVVS